MHFFWYSPEHATICRQASVLACAHTDVLEKWYRRTNTHTDRYTWFLQTRAKHALTAPWRNPKQVFLNDFYSSTVCTSVPFFPTVCITVCMVACTSVPFFPNVSICICKQCTPCMFHREPGYALITCINLHFWAWSWQCIFTSCRIVKMS